MTARLSVNISDDAANYLKEQAATHGVSVTEIVRRCVAISKLLGDEQSAGHEILIKSGDTYRQLVIL